MCPFVRSRPARPERSSLIISAPLTSATPPLRLERSPDVRLKAGPNLGEHAAGSIDEQAQSTVRPSQAASPRDQAFAGVSNRGNLLEKKFALANPSTQVALLQAAAFIVEVLEKLPIT